MSTPSTAIANGSSTGGPGRPRIEYGNPIARPPGRPGSRSCPPHADHLPAEAQHERRIERLRVMPIAHAMAIDADGALLDRAPRGAAARCQTALHEQILDSHGARRGRGPLGDVLRHLVSAELGFE